MDSAIPVITIDGPTASGKGTVAQRVARALGYACLDSGALYRIVGLLALERGVGLEDGPALAALAQDIDPLFLDDRIMLAGRAAPDRDLPHRDLAARDLAARDITQSIRREDVGAAASRVAAVPLLRTALLELQHRQRRPPGLVADGRDMGTVVFPDARLKVFLLADVRVRAERRYKQLMEKGYSAKLPDLLQSLQDRDARDQTRDCAPLMPAQDAKVIDSSTLGVDDVVALVLEWYRGWQQD